MARKSFANTVTSDPEGGKGARRWGKVFQVEGRARWMYAWCVQRNARRPVRLERNECERRVVSDKIAGIKM